jgi:hypothetical protein
VEIQAVIAAALETLYELDVWSRANAYLNIVRRCPLLERCGESPVIRAIAMILIQTVDEEAESMVGVPREHHKTLECLLDHARPEKLYLSDNRNLCMVTEMLPLIRENQGDQLGALLQSFDKE